MPAFVRFAGRFTGRFPAAGGHDAARWGRLDGDRVLPLAAAPWEGPAAAGDAIALSDVKLLPPATPSKILGVGVNYRRHAEEMGKAIPAEPLLFFKPPSALLPPFDAIVRPRGWERCDFEGELALVIGKPARHVPAARALDYVCGFTICNDVTVRDLQKKDGQFTRAKGFDSFCPVGPALVTDLDASDLAIRTTVNGELRQDGRTSDLIFSIAEIIACASRVMTLLPGDLITTGTPSGVGPIAPGDVVRITIDPIGTLENPVILEEPLQ